jgi:hypothetical protein
MWFLFFNMGVEFLLYTKGRTETAGGWGENGAGEDILT